MNKNELIKMINDNLDDDISIENIINELDNYICLLTEQNSEIIEQCIEEDPKYSDVLSPIIEPLGIYKNHSSCETISQKLDKNILEELVWKIAVENSIQGKNPEVKTYIADYVLGLGIRFYERLKDGEWELVEEMEHHVYNEGGEKRHECSWCSKVCKYLHEALFDEDKYYIYDSNVKNRFNDYRKYYGLSQTSKKSIDVKNTPDGWYRNLYNSLDELRQNRADNGESLTRNKLDHILWGFAKYKVEVARVR